MWQNTLTPGVPYLFDVVVRSVDNRREDAATVAVAVAAAGAPSVASATKITRFNADAAVTISAAIAASTAAPASTWGVTGNWTVVRVSDSVPVAVAKAAGTSAGALTPLSASFPAASAAAGVIFSLALAPNTLPPGDAYTFRLTAWPTGHAALSAFTEITLGANGPPTSGYLTVAPPRGVALSTVFVLGSVGWTTDASNLPLMFDFYYQLLALPPVATGLGTTGTPSVVSSPYPRMRLTAPKLTSILETPLPAGLAGAAQAIALLTHATDIYKSTGNATNYAAVAPALAALNITAVVNAGLAAAINNGDADLLGRTVALAASSLALATATARCAKRYTAHHTVSLYTPSCMRTQPSLTTSSSPTHLPTAAPPRRAVPSTGTRAAATRTPPTTGCPAPAAAACRATTAWWAPATACACRKARTWRPRATRASAATSACWATAPTPPPRCPYPAAPARPRPWSPPYARCPTRPAPAPRSPPCAPATAAAPTWTRRPARCWQLAPPPTRSARRSASASGATAARTAR
jgi:hypothetical protein